MSEKEDERMRAMREKLIGGGQKTQDAMYKGHEVVEIEDSPQKPKRAPAARRTTRGSTTNNEITIRLDGEAYEEVSSKEIELTEPSSKELIPASQISNTGYLFRDNLRRKLVDILMEKTKNPYLM
jgi:hypothetical protein